MFVQTASNANPIQSVTGTTTNRFDNLYDAIKRAYELGAPYTSATITIKLEDGTHGMLRSTYGMYNPQYTDKFRQTTTLVITSETGSVVTVNYKMADKFRFFVGAGLTISNIIFNGIDSLILPDSDVGSCLNSAGICCINSGGSLSGSASCAFVRQP